MAVNFNTERNRFIVDWKDSNGKRRYKALWRDATEEDAQRFLDGVRADVADPMRELRESLLRQIKSEPEHGNIYAISNELLPGMYKIGKTSWFVHERIKAFNTAHPVDWVISRTARVTHMSNFEKALHAHFHAERVNPNREFFRLDAGRLNAAFDLCLEIGGAEIRAKDLHRD